MEDKQLKEIEDQFTLAIKKKSICESEYSVDHNTNSDTASLQCNTNSEQKKRKRGRPKKQNPENYLNNRGNKIIDVIDVLLYKKDPSELKKIIKKRIQACSNMKKKKWNEEENFEFYQAIKFHGVDFSLIANEVKTKTYKQVQEKYNKELKKGNKDLQEAIEYFEKLGKTFLTPKLSQNNPTQIQQQQLNPKNIYNLSIIKPQNLNELEDISTDHIFPNLQLPHSAKISTPSTIKFDLNSPYTKDFQDEKNTIEKRLSSQQNRGAQKRFIKNESEQNSMVDENEQYQDGIL